MAGQRGGQEQANGERGKENESRLTVVLALGANLGIAVAKGFAALITGSASMAAETASVSVLLEDSAALVGVLEPVPRDDPDLRERVIARYGRTLRQKGLGG